MSFALSATPAVLTVELEPSAIAGQKPPEPLSRDSAELLAAPLADDLRRIIGEDIAQAGLIMPAALYDLTELLRPGLPMIEALLDIYRGSLRGGPFQPQLLAIGSSGGRFPESAIAPLRRVDSGPILALPFALVAPGPTLDPLRQKLESELLEKGRAGLAIDRALRQLLGVAPVNLSYATFHDCAALLKVQLEHAELGPLWQLIEAALYRPDQIERVKTANGAQMIGMGGAVWTPWLSFDAWAARTQADPNQAQTGYIQWLREQRQISAGLESHGIEVHASQSVPAVDAADAEVALSAMQAHPIGAEDNIGIREVILQAAKLDTAAAVTLTEQFDPQVGTIAYSALVQAVDGQLLALIHDYPLKAPDLNAIVQHWESVAVRLGASFQIEQPGKLIAYGTPATLQPWLDYQGHA